MGMDWQRLHDLSGGMREFEQELLAIFVDDTQSHVEAMERAIVAQDFTTLATEAHHIKGASANVGAVPMQEIALFLEQQAHQQGLAHTSEALAQLQTWLNTLRSYLSVQQ
jgi:HPt (histidine-containing phosphotransfer) domain-containing protein